MPWSPEAPSARGEPFPDLIYWTQPRTLLTSLLPPCGSFADAPGLCPSPLLFSLCSLSQASISHLQVLVTTCRPTAPKSLSLAQPPFSLIANKAPVINLDPRSAPSAPSAPLSQQRQGGRPSEAEHALFLGQRGKQLWPLGFQETIRYSSSFPLCLLLIPGPGGPERNAPSPSNSQPICTFYVDDFQVSASAPTSLSLNHRSLQS